MSKGTTSVWAFLVPGQTHLSLTEAHAVVQTAHASALKIKHELERVWNLLDLMGDSEGVVRGNDIERYGQALSAIDAALACSTYRGQSLIDGSGYSLDLKSGWRGHWHKQVPHRDLRLGPGGLRLPTLGELESGLNMSDASKEAKEAIEKIDETINDLETDLGALTDQADEIIPASELDETEDEGSAVKEIAQIVVIALVIAMIVRSFAFQFFSIPSGSMKSTLLIGDFVFVSKYAYGYSHKSFPLGIDFFEGRIWESTPKRGDVVVFKQTADGRTDYIKRVVGLPGDTVQMTNGLLIINGIEVAKEPAGTFLDSDPRNGTPDQDIPMHRETLPGGVVHTTLDEVSNGRFDNTVEFLVPEGHFFVMGDNRDNSADSRIAEGSVSFVPAEHLVGRAELVFFSVDGTAKFWEVWKWPAAIRYDRLLKKIE